MRTEFDVIVLGGGPGRAAAGGRAFAAVDRLDRGAAGRSRPDRRGGEASAISDVASRLGGAVLTALVPVLIGVQAGQGLEQALVHGTGPR
jgi:hypothetical protein